MWLTQLWKGWQGRSATGRRTRPPGLRKPRLRLTVERLEDRTLPSNYTAGTVAELIAAINAANLSPEADTIALFAGRTFSLTQVNNTTNGPTGLPTIAANSGNLTILGNGDTIERSTAAGTPAFGLFSVESGASLKLENLTLQGGAGGGAIFNAGTATLNGVTVQKNMGGGIYSSSGSSLTVQGGHIQNNQGAWGGGVFVAGNAIFTDVIVSSNTARGLDGNNGGPCGPEGPCAGQPGGSAFGGGLYVTGYGTTVSLTGVTLSYNTARGGDGGKGFDGSSGGDGGDAFGGGMYVSQGTATITVRTTIVTKNTAAGGAAGSGGGAKRGQGVGGGLYNNGGYVCLDAFTVSNVKRNKASTSDPNIYGWYTICS